MSNVEESSKSQGEEVASAGTGDPQEVAVQRLDVGGTEAALFEFKGQLRDLVVSSLQHGYLTTGNYAPDAKAVSPQSLQAMALTGASGAAMAGSSAFSSSLFMATANPATLMTLGNGVGSAVMGTSGIIAQAPFIPVAASLLVVAPLLAMQALSTAITLKQFEQVDKKLDAIKATLDTAIARSEATHAGELLTASSIVDEVYGQYEVAGSFSTDMLMRLAVAERDVRGLAERYRYLVQAHAQTEVDDLVSVQRANYDAHSAMLASFLDLRVAYLRVCVDMQENPKSLSRSVGRLKSKIETDSKFWEQLLHRAHRLREMISERETQLKDMNWVERVLPEFAGGKGSAAEKKLSGLRVAYTATLESELAITRGFDSLIRSAKQTLAALDHPEQNADEPLTFVYWKDESGEHSFYTEKLQLT